eukprot:4041119-Pyramimonas_sp.AAC.1
MLASRGSLATSSAALSAPKRTGGGSGNISILSAPRGPGAWTARRAAPSCPCCSEASARQRTGSASRPGLSDGLAKVGDARFTGPSPAGGVEPQTNTELLKLGAT